MNDDWRVQATLTSHGHAAELGGLLEHGTMEHDLETAAGERVVVSVDAHEVFLYAGTREQAERASAAVSKLAGDRGWELTAEVRHWHPIAEEWEDPDVPLPSGEAAVAGEHAEAIAHERSESSGSGFSEYEVRVGCATHHDTVALANQLRSEGIPCLRRWRYLLVGAADEDAAAALAERLSREAPAGCTITTEASLAAINAETPSNPFAVFGGLGG